MIFTVSTHICQKVIIPMYSFHNRSYEKKPTDSNSDSTGFAFTYYSEDLFFAQMQELSTKYENQSWHWHVTLFLNFWRCLCPNFRCTCETTVFNVFLVRNQPPRSPLNRNMNFKLAYPVVFYRVNIAMRLR